jgi:hypothetical protein
MDAVGPPLAHPLATLPQSHPPPTRARVLPACTQPLAALAWGAGSGRAGTRQHARVRCPGRVPVARVRAWCHMGLHAGVGAARCGFAQPCWMVPLQGPAVWCAGCCVVCVGVRAHGGCMCHAQGGPGLELAEAACRVSGKGLDGSAWLRPFGLRGGVEGAWRCPVLPPSARGPLGARSVGCGHRRWVPPRPESSFEALRAAWVGGAGSPPLACYGARCGGWLRARAARG